MTVLVVPLQAVPNQTVQVQLGNQNCQLNIYQKFFGLFMDILVNNVPIIVGVLCENLHFSVISEYLGFQGDLTFFDNQGNNNPDFTGLGDPDTARYNLLYFSPDDLPAGDF